MNSQTSTFKMLIDGALVEGDQTMAVINPCTGRPLPTVHVPRSGKWNRRLKLPVVASRPGLVARCWYGVP